MAMRVKVASFEAVGGPAQATRSPGDTFWAGPTDAGTYRVHKCGRHSSPSYPAWSKIRWGSDIKEEKGEVWVRHDGRWQTLKSLTTVTRDELILRNQQLYGKNELPGKWLFNDFGHMTCYFFKDKNNNRKLDRDLREQVHTEYFHTTPDDEAATATGLPVSLAESHGCIHLKPNDIDEMIDKGYFRPETAVVVHRYNEGIPLWTENPAGLAPFEVHFFPGAKQVVVTGRVLPSAPRRR
jgi:hypothetical protein